MRAFPVTWRMLIGSYLIFGKEYAFLALKGLHGLPEKLKQKVEEVDHHVNLVKAELQKKKDRDDQMRLASLKKQEILFCRVDHQT